MNSLCNETTNKIVLIFFDMYITDQNYFNVPQNALVKLRVKFNVFSEENMKWKARYSGDNDLYEAARNIETPACNKLHEIRNWG